LFEALRESRSRRAQHPRFRLYQNKRTLRFPAHKRKDSEGPSLRGQRAGGSAAGDPTAVVPLIRTGGRIRLDAELAAVDVPARDPQLPVLRGELVAEVGIAIEATLALLAELHHLERVGEMRLGIGLVFAAERDDDHRITGTLDEFPDVDRSGRNVFLDHVVEVVMEIVADPGDRAAANDIANFEVVGDDEALVRLEFDSADELEEAAEDEIPFDHLLHDAGNRVERESSLPNAALQIPELGVEFRIDVAVGDSHLYRHKTAPFRCCRRDDI